MTGLTVVYEGCLCSDAADDPTTIPERCPGHDRPIAGQWRNVNQGGLREGHDCPVHPCPTEENP